MLIYYTRQECIVKGFVRGNVSGYRMQNAECRREEQFTVDGLQFTIKNLQLRVDSYVGVHVSR
jgi:hypothetical protein